MTYIKTTDFNLEIAKGNVTKHSLITKFGFNDDVDTGTLPEDLWGTTGVYVQPTVARIHDFTSTSVNDTSAGTGARTILIRGINSSYNAQSETITLNGTSNVPTVNSYFHIHLVQVLTAGSTGNNVGLITGTAQTDATLTINVLAGNNQSVSSIYMVPTGYKAYLMRLSSRMNNSVANTSATVQLLNKPFGGVYQLKTQAGLNNSGSSFVNVVFEAPFILQAKSITKLSCSSVSNSNTTIEGEYDLILVQD